MKLLVWLLAVAVASGDMAATPRPSPAASPAAAAAPAKKDDAAGTALGQCKTCVYTLERIKQGYHYLLPNICEEILAKSKSDDDYSKCHKLLAGLSKWGADVRHWMHNGCYKVEPYNSMSLVQPCPSHVICSKITDVDNQAFCSAVTTDFHEESPAAF